MTAAPNQCQPGSAPVIRTPDEIELEALRGEVSMLLEYCTEKQRAFFTKLYPGGVESMDRDKLRNAVGLCQRTTKWVNAPAPEPRP